MVIPERREAHPVLRPVVVVQDQIVPLQRKVHRDLFELGIVDDRRPVLAGEGPHPRAVQRHVRQQGICIRPEQRVRLGLGVAVVHKGFQRGKQRLHVVPRHTFHRRADRRRPQRGGQLVDHRIDAACHNLPNQPVEYRLVFRRRARQPVRGRAHAVFIQLGLCDPFIRQHPVASLHIFEICSSGPSFDDPEHAEALV